MARANRRNTPRRSRERTIEQLPWRLPTHPYRPIEVLSADQLESLHDASLRVLEQLGIEGVDEAATGSVYHLDKAQPLARGEIQRLCERALANRVIQHYEVYNATGAIILRG